MTSQTSSETRRTGSGAPRTTFDRLREPREWDDILLAGLPGVALLLAVPLGVLIAAITGTAVRLTRRPWWTALLVTAAGLVWMLLLGPAEAWQAHIAAHTDLLATLARHPGDLGETLAPRVWLAAPLSTALGGTMAAGWRGYLTLRIPTYRSPSRPEVSARRIARTAEQIRTGAADPAAGVALGHNRDGRPVQLSLTELGLHGLVVGGTGSGKTTAMLQLLRGLTAPAGGAGLVYIDLKGDPTLARALHRLATAHGRRLRIWTMRGPAVWNPLGRGDATEQRDKLMGTLGPYTQEFYEAAARRYLQTVLNVLHHPLTRPPRPITLTDVDRLLDLDTLQRRVLGQHAEDRILSDHDPLCEEVAVLLGEYRADRELRAAVAGWRTRLATLRWARVGRWLDGDGIDLLDALQAGDLVLFSLDASRYQDAAAGIAKAVIRDLVTVAADLQADGHVDGTLAGTVVVDEFSAAGGDDLLALFARGRSAGLTTWLVTQDLADLDDPGGRFAQQVIANTNVKVIARVDVSESAETLAALAGTHEQWEETVQVTTDAPHLGQARGGATGMGSLRQVDRFRIHPNTVKELARGEVLLLVKHPTWRLEHLTVIPADLPVPPARGASTMPIIRTGTHAREAGR